AQRSERERHREHDDDRYRDGSGDARPERGLVGTRVQAVLSQVPDVTEQALPRQRLRIEHGEPEEFRRQARAHLRRLRALRHDAIVLDARLAVVLQAPDVVGVDARAARAPDAAQLVLRVELEHVHAAVAAVAGLLADRDDRAAVLGPGAAVTGQAVV